MNIPKRFHAAVLVVALAVTPLAQAAIDVDDASPVATMGLVDGATLFPTQLRGKVVLTVFWATWCPICMRELPEYQHLRERYASAGFEVVALSLDDSPEPVPEPVRDYVRRAEIRFPVAMRTPTVKEAWGAIQGTPLVFLTDRNGIVRAKHRGAPDLGELEDRIKALVEYPCRTTQRAHHRSCRVRSFSLQSYSRNSSRYCPRRILSFSAGVSVRLSA